MFLVPQSTNYKNLYLVDWQNIMQIIAIIKSFLTIAIKPELFFISGNDFAIPTRDNPLNYDVMIMPNDGSGYTGINSFNIQLISKSSNTINGNVNYYETQTTIVRTIILY